LRSDSRELRGDEPIISRSDVCATRESLGEYGMYLHGIPYAIAPDVQKAIPFIIWMSDEFIRRKAVHIARLESQRAHSQRDVFHTVMGAFSMRSDAYLGEYDIFSGTFSDK
jgi:lipid A ethanolaminephosphotransferase